MARILLNASTTRVIVRFIDTSHEDSLAAKDARLIRDSLRITHRGVASVDDRYEVIDALSHVLSGDALKRLTDGRDSAASKGGKSRRKSSPALHKKFEELIVGSSTLRKIADESSETPISLVKALVRQRCAIEKKLAEFTEADPWRIGCKLSALVAALVETNSLAPRTDWQTAVWLASAAEIYERSSILRSVSKQDLSSPQRLMKKLAELRPHILKTKRQTRRSDGVHVQTAPYSFLTLTRALIAAGRISERASREFETTAQYRDFYERSPALQRMDSSLTACPEAFIAALPRIRKQLIDEKSEVRDIRAEYSYSTIFRMLAAAGVIPEGRAEMFGRWASAMELFERSAPLRSIAPEDLMDAPTMVAKLRSIRAQVIGAESRSRLSIATMYLACLAGHGMLSGAKGKSKLQGLLRVADAIELYHHSRILQSIASKDIPTFDLLYDELRKAAPRVSREQKKLRRQSSRCIPTAYSVSTLMCALQYSGALKADQAIKDQSRVTSARTIFDRSATLKGIHPALLADDLQLTRFLVARRDRIAVENLKARGDIPADAYHFPEAERHYALGTLVGALRAGGLLDDKRAAKLHKEIAGPAEYFLRRRETIEPHLRELIAQGHTLHTLKGVDLRLFVALNDPSKSISGNYVRSVLIMGAWMMTEPAPRLRSILHAAEIVDMALSTAPEHEMPEEIRARLLRARESASREPAKARTDAVLAVKEMIEGSKSQKVSAAGENASDYFAEMDSIVEWNGDAIDEGATLNIDSAATLSPISMHLGTVFR